MKLRFSLFLAAVGFSGSMIAMEGKYRMGIGGLSNFVVSETTWCNVRTVQQEKDIRNAYTGVGIQPYKLPLQATEGKGKKAQKEKS